ncbi:hypothetical protein [Mucilaginibacter sp. HD30]
MENFQIQLNQQQFEWFGRPDTDAATLLNNLFAPATANYNQLALELQREFRQGGSPDVMRMAFDRVGYCATTGKGSVRIVLDVRFTFGCEDSITEKNNQTSEWTFKVNPLDKTITFQSSPFAEERSTADEF